MTKSKLILGAAALVATTAAYANPFTGKLYYTTFQGGVNVHSIDYAYDGSAVVYSNNTDIASTNGADGILFAPDGNLLVAGQANNIISEITPTGTPVATVAAGTGSYHLALSSNDPNATLYNMWNGGSGTSVSALTLLGGSISGALAGTPYTVTGGASQDVRGMVYDPANNTWYYGTAADGAPGDFGTVSFTGTTATLTPIASGEFAHGLTFDPFTNTIIFSSENTITQFDPLTSTFYNLTSLPNGNYDQSAVDGAGHLFVASNSGDIIFVDYSNGSNHVSSPAFTNVQFLATNLDDISPLSGSGSAFATPEPGALLLVGAALVAVGLRRRSAGPQAF